MIKHNAVPLAYSLVALSILPGMAGAQKYHASSGVYHQQAAASLTIESDNRFDQIFQQIEGLHLVRNKVYLYREAATALAPSQKRAATDLLLRALADLDSAQATLRDQRPQDLQQLKELDFAKRPVILQLIQLNQSEGLRVLEQPQAADSDTEFQRLVFEQLASVDLDAVQASALRKLSLGVTPAAVAAYAVLQEKDQAAARVLAADIVARLATQDPARDPQAVQAAFALLRLLRSDEGTRARHITINEDLLDNSSIEALFGFLGDALLSAKEPELLILPERPQIYLDALSQYAPVKAEQVRMLPFAAPNARSLIFTKSIPEANQAVSPVTPRTQERAAQSQLLAQLRDAAAEVASAHEKLDQREATPREIDQAVEAAIVATNKSFAMGRVLAASLQPEAFRDNEYEYDTTGPLSGSLASISSLLKAYDDKSASAALRASEQLESVEVQTAVELQLAIYAQTTPSPYKSRPPTPATTHHNGK